MIKEKKILYLGLETDRDDVFHYPVIKTVPRPLTEIREDFSSSSLWTHVILTSQPSLAYFFDASSHFSIPLEKKTFLIIGKKTNEKLLKRGNFSSRIASNETGEGIVDLLKDIDEKTPYFFYPHSSLSRPIISEALLQKKCPFSECILYDTFPHQIVPKPSLEPFEEIIFTSPSCVDAFIEIFGPLPLEKKLTAIGPITQKRLETFDSFPYC